MLSLYSLKGVKHAANDTSMRWVQVLEVEERLLVWMRAKRYDWQAIGRRFACDRTTAWRRWKRDMQVIADRLNRTP